VDSALTVTQTVEALGHTPPSRRIESAGDPSVHTQGQREGKGQSLEVPARVVDAQLQPHQVYPSKGGLGVGVTSERSESTIRVSGALLGLVIWVNAAGASSGVWKQRKRNIHISRRGKTQPFPDPVSQMTAIKLEGALECLTETLAPSST